MTVSKASGSIATTYLDINIFVRGITMIVHHSRCIHFVPNFHHTTLRQPHSERRLDLDDDPDLARRVILAIQSSIWVLVAQLMLGSRGRPAAAHLTHFESISFKMATLTTRFFFCSN